MVAALPRRNKHKQLSAKQEDQALRAEISSLRQELFAMQMAQPEWSGMGQRQDHRWASASTGHGTSRDLPETLRGVRDARSTDEELDSLYAGNGLARQIVDLPIDEALQGWITIKHPDAKVVKLLNDQLDTLGIFPKTHAAARYGRLKRLGVVYMDIDDGQSLDQPVDVEKISAINLTTVFDRSQITPYSFNMWSGPDAVMEPVHYQVSGNGLVKIHKDRLMIFPGLDAGFNNFVQCGGMGESVIDTLKRQLRNLENGYNQAAHMAMEHRTKSLHMEGFSDKSGANSRSNTADALRRLQVMRSLVGVINGLVMGQHDKVEYASAPLNGYPELVQLAKEILCWFTGIPYAKLFGESSGNGLNNGKGEYQSNNWALVIGKIREFYLRPQLNKILRYLAALNGIEEQIDFEFPPLFPQTPKEEAETRKLNAEAQKLEAEADAIRIDYAIITRKESRVGRYVTTGDQSNNIQVEGDEPPSQVDRPTSSSTTSNQMSEKSREIGFVKAAKVGEGNE